MEKTAYSYPLLSDEYNITNLSNSFLAHFGVTPFHKTIPVIDELLKGRKKVCVFLFDGMGDYVLSRHKEEGKTFIENGCAVISSTNPATTVASTTSFLTGKSPIETGWLGWAVPILPGKDPVEVFKSTSFLSGEKMGDNLMEEICPVTKIDELMNRAGHKSKILYQYGVGGRFDGPSTFEEAIPLGSKYFEEGGEFLYIYFNTPDGIIHHHGVDCKDVGDCIAKAAKTVEGFVEANPDVLTFVIADHGLIDVKTVDLAAYPEITSCLSGPTSLELRTINFFVKKEKVEEFKRLVAEKIPQIRLVSREFALSSNYFGEGVPTPNASSYLGDYIGIVQDNSIIIDYSTIFTQGEFVAHHAGCSPEEKNILVSCFNRR